MRTLPRIVDAARLLLRRDAYIIAADAMMSALRSGFDPATDIVRRSVSLDSGELLLMPSQYGLSAGLKVITVSPANPDRGLPRNQGQYLLYDGATLTLRAILDGAALTMIRTPAVTLAAIGVLLTRAEDPLRLVVFGTGPQAMGHAAAIRQYVSARRRVETTFLMRAPERASVVVPGRALRMGDQAADAALASAHVVICATSARTPLFDSEILPDDAVIAAVGSHEPTARELDSALMARARVIVESRVTAMRECGDVAIAIGEGALKAESLITMRDAVLDPALLTGRGPIVFKSAGMSWQDLIVAEALVR